ncbi:hypothetical protein [Corallococcus exiguus]|uniref:hypothetical protein n=1 Tax=Corallococcus exiguus TaxID=83462 RepID=UPI00156043F3|nr:hypothetical protein [Corallococcus exiguus]NRD55056.1 hypothetical protein [Corallococcus exiguus]
MAHIPSELVAAFRGTAARTLSSEEDTALAPILMGILERCEAAWPGVRLAPKAFVAHLGLHTPPSEPLAQALSSLHCEDLYLALASVEGQRAALDGLESAVLVPAGERCAAWRTRTPSWTRCSSSLACGSWWRRAAELRASRSTRAGGR